MRLDVIAGLLCTCAVLLAACADSNAALKIIVAAPDYDCSDVPMSIAVPEGLKTPAAMLVKADGSKTIAQIADLGEGPRLCWVLDELKAGQKLAYTVEPCQPPAGGIEMKPADAGIDVTIGGKPFTTYHKISGHKPICYPLLGPGGAAMTRNYPMKKVEGEKADHPHHRSFWFTHGDVNGVDFWSESGKAGKIVQDEVSYTKSGPVVGVISTTNNWVSREGKRICRDARRMAVWNVKNGRMYDFTVTLTAPDGPVKLGDTKEGSFGFRTASTMKPDAGKGGVVVNAQGDKNKDTWGKASPWVDMYGPVDGATVGIAFMEHPDSFRAPTYWHARTYGLVAANPFGLHHFLNDNKQDGSHTIDKGGSITFRFRIWLHEGSAGQANVARAWKQLAQPPKAAVSQ